MKSRNRRRPFVSLGDLGDPLALRSGFVLILALLVAGCGGGAVVSESTLPPQAPTSLTAEFTPGDEVLLRWKAPAPAEGRAPVTGYEVYLELAGGRVRTLGDTESLSYRHLGVSGGGGGRYVYHVRALSAAGPSDPSESAFVDVPPDPLPPQAPVSLTAELTPGNEALLRWRMPPPAEGRAAVTGYEIYLESEDGLSRVLGNTRSLSYRHQGLRAGERYVYHVRALSAAGKSVPSESAYVDVPPGPVSPQPPRALTAALTPEGHALLQWAAPMPAEDRAAVTGYEVYLERTGGGTPQRIGATAGALSFRHTGLSPSRRYVYHVRALSAAGKSVPSESAYVDVPPGPVPPEPPRALTAALTPEGHALLQWVAPTPAEGRVPVTDYEVYLEPADGTLPRSLGKTRGALSYRHTGGGDGLTSGTRYVYHVRALGTGGRRSQPSESAFVDVPLAQPPQAPGSFTAELTANGEALLRWTAPVPEQGRAPVMGYRVYFQSTTGGDLEPLPVTSAVFFVHSNLSPGTYIYHVVALYDAGEPDLGESEPSAAAFIEVPGVPGLPLAAPRLSVRAYDDQRAVPDPDNRPNHRQVRIAWIQPLSEPPSTLVVGFLLQFCDVESGHASDHCPNGWEDLSVIPEVNSDQNIRLESSPQRRSVNDLINCDPEGDGTTRPARRYRIQALAAPLALASPWSATVGPVCPSADYSPPRRVDALFVEPAPVPTFNVCWEVPVDNGSPVTGYEIQMSPDEELPGTEDGWWVLDGHVNATLTDPPAVQECRLYSGLASNAERWFRIRAYNLSGHGDWSAPYFYRHAPDPIVPAAAARSAQSPEGVLSVADARAVEREGAVLGFEVTLEDPMPAPVTVDYLTEDGTAKAGEDYIGTAGTLVFAPGETAKRIEVSVLDDARDEGEETLTLRLRDAARAIIADAEAIGTIENDDRMPAAWLARFGRTIAAQTVEAMGDRLASAPASHVSVGGVSLRLSELGETRPSDAQAGRARWPEEDGEVRTLAGRALLRSSAFHLSTPGDGGPTFSAWGRFATGAFDAVTEEDARLDGDVTTGFLGMDVDGGRWLAGAMLSHSEGEGAFRFESAGGAPRAHHEETRSTLTGVYPYARLNLDERVSLWGLAGGGRGALTLSGSGGAALETDIDMTMGALGARAALLSPAQAAGLALDLRSDAFWTRTRSDALRSGRAGNLAGTRSDASRLRVLLEGARTLQLAAGGTLTPSLEAGVRLDGGEAETGVGLEVGAGLHYAGAGVSVGGALRTLLAHHETGYEEWEASARLRIDPQSSGRGLSLTLAPAFSATGDAGARPWWGDDLRSQLAERADFGPGKRLDAELGYGVRLSGVRGLLTPYGGLSIRGGGTREWRLGTRWAVVPSIDLSLEGACRRAAGEEDADRALMLRGALRL